MEKCGKVEKDREGGGGEMFKGADNVRGTPRMRESRDSSDQVTVTQQESEEGGG